MSSTNDNSNSLTLAEKTEDIFDNFFYVLKSKNDLSYPPCSKVKVEIQHSLIKDIDNQVLFTLETEKGHGEEGTIYLSSGLICVLIDALTSLASAAKNEFPYSVSVNLVLQVEKKIETGQKIFMVFTYLGRDNDLVRTRMTIYNDKFEICYVGDHIKMEVREKL